jgi:hypothetical protein
MDSLLSAKSDFASLGSSLASIQQNAVDDQISNNAAVQNYNNVSAQLKASIPSSFGELAFGAYEFGGQAKSLLTRIGNVIEGVKAAPDAIKAALVKGGNQLGARGNELKTLASETTGKIQETANTLKTNLGASVEELKTVASGAVGDLQTAAQTAATSSKAALETAATSGRTALETAATSGRTALETAATSGRTALETAATSRLTPLTQLAEPTAQDAARALSSTVSQATTGVSKELTDILPTLGATPSTDLNLFRSTAPYLTGPSMPSLTGVEIPGVSSTAGDFLRGLIPESLITRPDEEILPQAKQALTSTVSGLQEEASSGVANILGAGKQAEQVVSTTLANTTAKGGALANDLVSGGVQTGEKVASTLQSAGTAALDVVKGGVTDIAATAAEASSAVIPVVGEVVGAALGAVQLYEGFKDLFDHPSAAKPVTVPMPQIANIAQGFQSGI